MGWTSGACEPEPGSGPPGAYNPALHFIERTVETALECMEEVEANLPGAAADLPTTRVEQAVLEAWAGALAEELRVVQDYIAKLVGRVELAGRERVVREDGRVADDLGLCPSAGLCGDETAVSRSVAPGSGDAVAGRCEDEPVMSRRALINVMGSWPGVQAWTVQLGAGVTSEQRGGTNSGGSRAGKLRAYGFGRFPRTQRQPE